MPALQTQVTSGSPFNILPHNIRWSPSGVRLVWNGTTVFVSSMSARAAPIIPEDGGILEEQSPQRKLPISKAKAAKGEAMTYKSVKSELVENEIGQEQAFNDDEFEEEGDKDLIEIYRVPP